MLRRLAASWLDRRTRVAPGPRSDGGVPALFAPRADLVGGSPGARRLSLDEGELEIAGEIDWRSKDRALHAMEYVAALEDIELVSIVDSWLSRSRVPWEASSLALRCTAWMREISARGAALPRDFVARASASIVEQTRFLEMSLEEDSPLAILKTMVFAGRFFAGPGADRWTKVGLERLERHVSEEDLRSWPHLLECRAAVEDEGWRRRLDATLDRMAQASVDLGQAESASECLRVHAALGGRVPSPRPAFAHASAGCYGLRGDESLLVARDDLDLEWSLGGLPFVVGGGAAGVRGQVEDQRLGEGSLDLRIACGGVRRLVRATHGRIEVEDEIEDDVARSLRTRLLLHPAVEIEVSRDARRAVLRRKGICAILESPSPIRVAPGGASGRLEIVLHHGIAPCMGELSLEHVPASRDSQLDLDSVPGIEPLRAAPPPTPDPVREDRNPIRTESSRRR